MKFGQLIDIRCKIIFFKNDADYFKKNFIKGKNKWLAR